MFQLLSLQRGSGRVSPLATYIPTLLATFFRPLKETAGQ